MEQEIKNKNQELRQVFLEPLNNEVDLFAEFGLDKVKVDDLDDSILFGFLND